MPALTNGGWPHLGAEVDYIRTCFYSPSPDVVASELMRPAFDEFAYNAQGYDLNAQRFQLKMSGIEGLELRSIEFEIKWAQFNQQFHKFTMGSSNFEVQTRQMSFYNDSSLFYPKVKGYDVPIIRRAGNICQFWGLLDIFNDNAHQELLYSWALDTKSLAETAHTNFTIEDSAVDNLFLAFNKKAQIVARANYKGINQVLVNMVGFIIPFSMLFACFYTLVCAKELKKNQRARLRKRIQQLADVDPDEAKVEQEKKGNLQEISELVLKEPTAEELDAEIEESMALMGTAQLVCQQERRANIIISAALELKKQSRLKKDLLTDNSEALDQLQIAYQQDISQLKKHIEDIKDK